MVRLADSLGQEPAVPLADQGAVVSRIEAEFRARFAQRITVPEGMLAPDQFFRWGEELPALVPRLQGFSHWRQVQGQAIVPAVRELLGSLDRAFAASAAEAWRDWRARYVPELEKLFAAVGAEASRASGEFNARIAEAIDPLLPEERRGESLSRKAIAVVASTPGVTSVLTGIRRAAYVDDALGVLAWPPIPAVERIYAAARGLVAT
jgi:hypothetical protein